MKAGVIAGACVVAAFLVILVVVVAVLVRKRISRRPFLDATVSLTKMSDELDLDTAKESFLPESSPAQESASRN